MPGAQFIEVVDAHYASLYRFALGLVANANDASDLVQQTFLIWARKCDTLRDGSKAKSWLFTTLYREFLRLRSHDGRARSLEELPDGCREIAAQEIDHARRLDAADVMAALGKVNEPYRAPLILYYLDNFSYHEIAETLDVPLGTVMSRLSRGKAQLRSLVSGKKADGVPSGTSPRGGSNAT
jgi:RNA polymerase sigma-70 factor, ECF subfamily